MEARARLHLRLEQKSGHDTGKKRVARLDKSISLYILMPALVFASFPCARAGSALGLAEKRDGKAKTHCDLFRLRLELAGLAVRCHGEPSTLVLGDKEEAVVHEGGQPCRSPDDGILVLPPGPRAGSARHRRAYRSGRVQRSTIRRPQVRPCPQQAHSRTKSDLMLDAHAARCSPPRRGVTRRLACNAPAHPA